MGLGANAVVSVWVMGEINRGKESRVNEPQTVDRLDARDLLVRAFGVVALLVVAFVALYAI
jgi:hypothetical protein